MVIEMVAGKGCARGCPCTFLNYKKKKVNCRKKLYNNPDLHYEKYTSFTNTEVIKLFLEHN